MSASVYSEDDEWSDLDADGLLELINATGIDIGDIDLTAGAGSIPITFTTDAGQKTLVNLPVSADATQGDAMAYDLQVDGQRILNVFAEADGAGGIQNARVTIPVDLVVDGDTTEVDNVVTGDITLEDGATNEQFRLDATANPPLADFHGNKFERVGPLDFDDRTTDPTLESGLVWHRSDEQLVKFSPDGTNTQQLGWEF